MKHVDLSEGNASVGQAEVPFHELLECAQNVLRGRGDPGILGRIADTEDRKRLASALWIEGADEAAFEFWCHILSNMLLDNGIDPSCVKIHRSSICPCGQPLAHHAEDDYLAPSGVSRAWHLYTTSRRLDANICNYRVQAVAQHPLLLDCVIETAYGWRGPASRRVAAWRVLHAIDHREPLIEALCRFFRVGPAAIRAMRQWRPSSRQYWITYPMARRVASLLADLPHEKLMDLDSRAFWRWLAVAHVIRRCAGVTSEYLMRSECLDGIERLRFNKQVKGQELLGKLRQAIRWLRCERYAHDGLPRPDRMFAAIGIPPPPRMTLEYCFALPLAWMAARLDTSEAIREEAITMRHCIQKYTNELAQGQIQAYSLRSREGRERVTLMVRPFIGLDDCEEIHLTISGPGNESISLDALEAVLAMMRIVSPKGARMRVGSNFR